MSGRVRICLDFDIQEGLENSWFLVDPATHSLISDVAKKIQQRYLPYHPSESIVMRLQNFVLPAWESVLIFRDNDVVSVRVEKREPNADHKSTSSKTKRRRKESKNSENEDNDPLEDNYISEQRDKEKSTKKKHRIEKAHETVPDDTRVISSSVDYLQSDIKSNKHRKKHKRDKIENVCEETGSATPKTAVKHVKSVLTKSSLRDKSGMTSSDLGKSDRKSETESIASTSLESNVNDKTDTSVGVGIESSLRKIEASSSREESEMEISINSNKAIGDSQTECTEISETAAPHKRKRHRKRKRKSRNNISLEKLLDTNSDVSKSSLNDSYTKTNIYQGRNVGKDEQFYGSLPDKLEPPKYYRHGYRNLQTYKVVPNKHTTFDSDSESKNNTEQYNFLCQASKPEENLETMSEKNVETEIEQVTPRRKFKVNGHNTEAYSALRPPASEWQIEVSGSSDTGTVGRKNVSDYFETNKVDMEKNNGACGVTASRQGKLEMNGDTVEVLGAVNEKSLEGTFSASYMNNIYTTQESPETPILQNGNYTAVPLQYAELNKTHENEDMVAEDMSVNASPVMLGRKTLSSGVSVFFRPDCPRKKFKLSKEDQINTHAYNVSTIIVNPKEPEFKIPASPARRPKMSPSMSPKMSPNESSVKSDEQMTNFKDDEEQLFLPDESLKLVKTEKLTATDYSKLPPLTGAPEFGDMIAYKILEISVNCTPEVSPYKIAKVLSVDSNQMVELQNLHQPDSEPKRTKFHVEMEGEDEILTNTEEVPERVTLHLSSLLEPRIFHNSK